MQASSRSSSLVPSWFFEDDVVQMSERQEGPGWWMASDGKWYPPESHPDVRRQPPPPSAQTYAGFWLRVWATLIDGVILNVATGIVGTILGISSGFFSDEFDPAGFVLSVLAGWLYGALMESSSGGATIGKMVLNIKVTDMEGERIAFGTATARHFGKYLSAIILGIGFMMAGWTQKKQALHDMLANTLVVRVPKTGV